jgi:transposase-like protein
VPAKSADESTIRLLLADRQQGPLTVYTDGFRAYDPLVKDEQFNRKYVIHGDGEYADDGVYVNTCESHASLARRWLSPHRGISKDRLTQYLRAFQLRRESTANPDEKRSNTPSKQLSEINNVLHKSDDQDNF